MNNFYFGKLVYITGGSSGIGLGLATELAGMGARLVLIARNEKKLQDAIVSLSNINTTNKQRENLNYLSVDVTDDIALRRSLDEAVDKFGIPDVLITSAGIATAKPFLEHSIEDFRANLDSNVLGTISVIHALTPHMLRNGGGTIAMLGSLGGILPVWGYSAYSTSKASLQAFAEVLRYELGPQGIKVSLICPPEVKTPMIEAETATVPKQTRFIKDLVGTSAIQPVAQHSLRHIARGKALIIRSFRANLFYQTQRLFPGTYRFIVSSLLKLSG